MMRQWVGLILGLVLGFILGAASTSRGGLIGVSAQVACEMQKMPFDICFWIGKAEQRLDALERSRRP